MRTPKTNIAVLLVVGRAGGRTAAHPTMTMAERARALHPLRTALSHAPFFFMKKVFRRWPSTLSGSSQHARNHIEMKCCASSFHHHHYHCARTYTHSHTHAHTHTHKCAHNTPHNREHIVVPLCRTCHHLRHHSTAPPPPFLSLPRRAETIPMCRVYSRSVGRRRRHRLHRARVECGGRHHTATPSPNDRITDLRSTCTRRVDIAGVAAFSEPALSVNYCWRIIFEFVCECCVCASLYCRMRRLLLGEADRIVF